MLDKWFWRGYVLDMKRNFDAIHFRSHFYYDDSGLILIHAYDYENMLLNIIESLDAVQLSRLLNNMKNT